MVPGTPRNGLTLAQIRALMEANASSLGVLRRLLPDLTPAQRGMVVELLQAERRARQRRRSDRITDPARRLTIGARIPRETAERYQAAAADVGMSAYEWTWRAVERQYREQTGEKGPDYPY